MASKGIIMLLEHIVITSMDKFCESWIKENLLAIRFALKILRI